MSRVFVVSGPNGLIEAADALLNSAEFDMAAITTVLDPNSTLLENLDDGSRQNDRANSASLSNELPQLDVVAGLIRADWAKHGYRGMEIVDGFLLDKWRKPGIMPHVDELVYRDTRIEAGLQLSLCVKGLRRFMAERLPYSFRKADGTFDANAYREFYRFDGKLFQEIKAGRTPRSEATLRPGDVAMFPHHPTITLHGATNIVPSIARLISFNAEEPAH